MKKSAFTLIELIFTILILGFIATAMPMIMVTDIDAREDGLVQEAIYAATAKMSQILSYKWDEANNEDNATISGAKVLDIPASADTDGNFSRVGVTKFRVGHFQETGRRSMYNNINATNASALGNDANDAGVSDDIDDQVNTNLVSGAASAEGYKEAYDINVTSSYIIDNSASIAGYLNSEQNGFEFDRPTASPTNIKRILVNVTDANNQILFTLTTYSCNIGESSVASRIFN